MSTIRYEKLLVNLLRDAASLTGRVARLALRESQSIIKLRS